MCWLLIATDCHATPSGGILVPIPTIPNSSHLHHLSVWPVTRLVLYYYIIVPNLCLWHYTDLSFNWLHTLGNSHPILFPLAYRLILGSRFSSTCVLSLHSWLLASRWEVQQQETWTMLRKDTYKKQESKRSEYDSNQAAHHRVKNSCCLISPSSSCQDDSWWHWRWHAANSN